MNSALEYHDHKLNRFQNWILIEINSIFFMESQFRTERAHSKRTSHAFNQFNTFHSMYPSHSFSSTEYLLFTWISSDNVQCPRLLECTCCRISPRVLSQLYENNKIASASHNSYAYRIQSQSNNNSLQCVRRLAFHPQLCFRSASSAISSTQSIIFVVVSECRTMTMMARNQQANVFSIFLKLRM